MVELNLFLSLADTEFMIPGISVLKHENLLRNQKLFMFSGLSRGVSCKV